MQLPPELRACCPRFSPDMHTAESSCLSRCWLDVPLWLIMEPGVIGENRNRETYSASRWHWERCKLRKHAGKKTPPTVETMWLFMPIPLF
jgi:hypothetical protein